jgi:hypothetical protein
VLEDLSATVTARVLIGLGGAGVIVMSISALTVSLHQGGATEGRRHLGWGQLRDLPNRPHGLIEAG